MLNIPSTSRFQFNNLVFIFPSSSRVCYICVSDVRQKLEAPQKEKHKKNKDKHKTKKEHRRRKEKVSSFWVSWDRRQAQVSPLLSSRKAPPPARCDPRCEASHRDGLVPGWGHVGLSIPWQKC